MKSKKPKTPIPSKWVEAEMDQMVYEVERRKLLAEAARLGIMVLSVDSNVEIRARIIKRREQTGR